MTVLSRLCLQQKNRARKDVKNAKWSSNSQIFPSFPTNKECDIIDQLQVELHEKSPTDLCAKLFDNELLALLIDLNILYARQNTRHRFTCCLSEMKSFFGVLMFSGNDKLSQEEMYLSLDPNCSTSIVREALTRQRYREIKGKLHFSDNANFNKDDKLLKARPLMDLLNKKFL